MIRPTKLNWHEPTAYGTTLLSLAIGVFYAMTGHPDALGSAGSVIIVCGVLLASSRKIDALHAKAINFMISRREAERPEIKKLLTTPKGCAPSDQDVDEVLETVLRDGIAIVNGLIEERKRIFKIHEVVLVSVGTLVNGFGPVVVKKIIEIAS